MRYLPLSSEDREDMLARIGVEAIDDLYADAPRDALLTEPLDLPRRKGELEVERRLSALAAKNVAAGAVPFFVGAGAYKHHVPASVDHLIQRSEFLTSYTPYQPEISQGTLQVLFEFQTQVANLTGMEVANASMYDGSTATAEAILMAHRVTRRRKALVSGGVHPHYAETARTLSDMAEDEIAILPPDPHASEDLIGALDASLSCVVVQNPDFFGNLRDLRPLAEACRAKGVLLVAVVTEIVSLGLVESPGAMGADIVVGEGQSIGNGLNFGGPYVGLFAAQRKIPAPDAGPPLRPDRGFRRAARLRADPFDPRAAYPPRKGDLEHLHQFRPLRARLFDPSVAARRDRAETARADQSCQRRGSGRGGRGAFRAWKC